MRRKDKEITDISEIEQILSNAQVIRLGLCEDGFPYVVPLCFGYIRGRLYFHGAKEGRKLNILKSNPNICFEADIDCEIVRFDKPCNWGMRFRSVIGFGKAYNVLDRKEKIEALNLIMKHYGPGSCEFPANMLERTEVIRIEIESLSAKISGYGK